MRNKKVLAKKSNATFNIVQEGKRHFFHKSNAEMELDATPIMEVGAREPGNDDKEKMTPTVPTIYSDPITPPT
jgi:hypothetical protein